MALPGGYLPGPDIGGIKPIYNQYSGNLAGYMDANGHVTFQTSGLENYPQTYALATNAATATPASAAAQQAATVNNYYSGNAPGAAGAGGTTGAASTGVPTAAPGQQPESVALQQMQQIDPASEALRTAVANSYLTPLQQAGTPTAAQFQNYLNLYKQIDPSGAAARQALGDQVSSQLALGSQLDPVTARQVEQQTRMGQAARGNVYGTPQMVEEAMTTGQAGQALQQQRQQAALSYLTSGQTLGDTAMNLYNTQQSNLRANQQGALGYLTSGATPYQTGASYVDRANAAAATAAQGGPVYNPSSLGASYGASQIPQYGLDIGQQAQNWYNSLQAYSGAGGGATKNKGAAAASGAATGALSGAVGGATLGSVVPGVGTLVGAGVGAVAGGVMGGAGGYFS